MIYGQDITEDGELLTNGCSNGNGTSNGSPSSAGKIDLDLVVNLYERFVIPLTKVVEVEYLMRRLD